MEVSSLYLNVEFKHVGNQRLEASEELNTHSYLEDEGASMVRNLNVGSVADRPWVTVIKGVRPQSRDKNRNELGRRTFQSL